MKQNKIGKTVAVIIVGIGLLASLYPVFWLLMSSLKTTQEFSLYLHIRFQNH